LPQETITKRRRTLGIALATFAGSLLLLIPFYHLPLSETDEGLIAVGAERILNGQIPFRDFFSELGPASFYFQAVIFKMAGINVTSLRVVAWLLGGAITALIFLIARRIVSNSLALLAASIFPLICYPSAYRVSHHWWANLFLLLTVLVLAGSIPRESSDRRRSSLLVAGMVAGMTLLAMQSLGFWTILMATVFLSIEPWFGGAEQHEGAGRRGVESALWFLLATGAVLGMAAGYFALHGALDAWIEDNLFFLFTNYRTYLDVPQASAVETAIHVGRLALTQPSVHYCLYFAGYLFFFFVAPALAFGLTTWRLRPANRPGQAETRALLLILLEAIGAFLAECHAPDVFHLMAAAPLTLVLLVYHWGRMVRAGGLAGRLAKVAAIGALGLMTFTAARKAVITLRIDVPVQTRRGVIYVRPASAEATRTFVEAVEQRAQPGSETFFFPYAAELYFLTATRNPTRFDVLVPEFHTNAQVGEAVAALRRARPEFVFSFDAIQRWTIRPHFPDDPPDVLEPHPVERTLRLPGSGYHLAATVAGMEVWAADQ